MPAFGERLKALRKQNNLTQVDMSKILNITERGYQNYEIGKSTPNVAALLFIADYFDVSIDYLVGRTDNRDSHKL